MSSLYPMITLTMCLAVGCNSAQNMHGEADMQSLKVPSPTTKEKQVSELKDPIVLKVDWYHEEGPCVQLQEDGPCLKSPNDLREAAPDLHKRYAHLGALAQIFHRFHPGISDEVFPRQTSYQKWWAKWFEPDDFFARQHGYLRVQPSGVTPETVHDAKLEGDKLVYFSARVIGIDHGVQVFRNVVDFASADWTPQITELETSGQPRRGLNERATALFGGLAQGFAHAKLPTGDLYLVDKPEEGASAFVWRDKAQAVERFKDWASLVKAHPEAASDEAARHLANAIAHYPLSSGRQLIEDSAAYKKEYKDNGWSEERLRYYVDQLRITHYTIDDWDAITDPVIKDGVLVAHFRQGRQPSRMTYALASFSAHTAAEYVEIARSKVISDSQGGPSAQPLQELIKD